MSDYGIELTGEEEARIDELCDKIRKNMESEPMTPRERFNCVANGDEPDRIPIQVCAMGLHVAALSGISPGELYDDLPMTRFPLSDLVKGQKNSGAK